MMNNYGWIGIYPVSQSCMNDEWCGGMNFDGVIFICTHGWDELIGMDVWICMNHRHENTVVDMRNENKTDSIKDAKRRSMETVQCLRTNRIIHEAI